MKTQVIFGYLSLKLISWPHIFKKAPQKIKKGFSLKSTEPLFIYGTWDEN